jgi:dCMP deaminase
MSSTTHLAKPTIIVAYIPVLHQGYFNFLSKYSTADELWLLTEETMNQFAFFRKDVRRLAPELVMQGIAGWGFQFNQVKAQGQALANVTPGATVVMPDDQVSHWLEEEVFSGQSLKLVFDPVFLRWDNHIILAQKPPTPSTKLSSSQRDKELMGQAFTKAADSTNWWRHVGCLISRAGQPILVGMNRHLPTEYTHFIDGDMRSLFTSGKKIELASSIHAEASLIAQAAREGTKLEGADLYVTDFPCPVCAKQIAAAGIKRVFYAQGYSLIDGEDILQAAGVEIIQVSLSPAELEQLQQPDRQKHIILSYT